MSLVPVVDALKARGWVEEECISTMSLTKHMLPGYARPAATVWFDERLGKWRGCGDEVELKEARVVVSDLAQVWG